MKITKSQLKEIIKEEVSRLQKKIILENRKDAEKQVYLSQTQINLAINTLEEVSRQLKNPELVTPSDQRELYIDVTNARKALSIAQHNQIYKNPKNSLDNMFKGTTPDDIDF